jgi:hypothetical protein
MMYPWRFVGCDFTAAYVARLIQKEVRKLNANNMIVGVFASSKNRDYESEGRAFESLRVRHFLRVSEDFKKRFVPLFKECTSFEIDSMGNATNNLGEKE